MIRVGGTVAAGQLQSLAKQVDLDGDGVLTVEDSKIATSRIAPVVKQYPGLAGGFATGFVAAYRFR